jgi:hypothetical protein
MLNCWIDANPKTENLRLSSKGANELNKDGIITGNETGALQSCAGQLSFPSGRSHALAWAIAHTNASGSFWLWLNSTQR